MVHKRELLLGLEPWLRWLGTPVALAEDLGSIPSTHVVVGNSYNYSSRGPDVLLSALKVLHKCTDVHRSKTPIHTKRKSM